MKAPEFALQAEHLFSMYARLQSPPETIGAVPEGIRMTFYVDGGWVAGERLQAELLPVGADWFTLRQDGVGELDVRATLRTDTGALIQLTYPGLADFGADGYERCLEGVMPAVVGLRTSPCMRSAHTDYQWLHRLHCVGIGEANLETLEVRYDVYVL